MTLHLARLPVDLPALARAAGERGWTHGSRAAFDEGAALHHLLGEAFGPGALKPFRLIVAPRARSGTLYAYTERDADALRDVEAGVGLSEAHEAAIRSERLETKPMPTAWAAGRRVGFDIRLRPVVRLAKPCPAPSNRMGRRRHGFAKGTEVDAFLAEALRRGERDGMEMAGRDRAAVYAEWFSARLDGAAGIEEATLVAFRRTRVARGERTAEGPDAILQGTLIVQEPVVFADRVRRGVGRHKAYGYGMLMLRPPGRAVPVA